MELMSSRELEGIVHNCCEKLCYAMYGEGNSKILSEFGDLHHDDTTKLVDVVAPYISLG